jgi:hypothetical protein
MFEQIAPDRSLETGICQCDHDWSGSSMCRMHYFEDLEFRAKQLGYTLIKNEELRKLVLHWNSTLHPLTNAL